MAMKVRIGSRSARCASSGTSGSSLSGLEARDGHLGLPGRAHGDPSVDAGHRGGDPARLPGPVVFRQKRVKGMRRERRTDHVRVPEIPLHVPQGGHLRASTVHGRVHRRKRVL